MKKQIAVYIDVEGLKYVMPFEFLRTEIEKRQSEQTIVPQKKLEYESFQKERFDKTLALSILIDLYNAMLGNASMITQNTQNKVHFNGTLEGVEGLIIHLTENDYYDLERVKKAIPFGKIEKHLSFFEVEPIYRKKVVSECDENDKDFIGYAAKVTNGNYYFGWRKGSYTLLFEDDKNTLALNLSNID